MASLISKARKPKFHLHLKIYDLNNVPLISGVSVIKWHLPHSIHSEHRGRTQKCPIANHRVEYDYARVIPFRIVIDRAGNLTECPIEFEVTQEFSNPGTAGGGNAREEKTTLGVVRINLSEYVEESDALLRPGAGRVQSNFSEPLDKTVGHARQRSSLSGISSLASSSTGGDMSGKPPFSHGSGGVDGADVEDGVMRRYLMQDSKINSTLKIGILMVQVEGERNYIAPPLKTAPVFGGIAGMMPGAPLEDPADGPGPGSSDGAGTGGTARVASFNNKSRDAHELQDMYRRALAASWASQPGELAADECVEDIFSGGDGFHSNASDGDVTPHHSSLSAAQSSSSSGLGIGRRPLSRSATDHLRHFRSGTPSRNDSGASASGVEDDQDGMDTLRPRDMARIRHHFRANSGPSGRAPPAPATTTAFPAFEDSRGPDGGGSGQLAEPRDTHVQSQHERREISKEGSMRSRSESLTSLATTAGSSERRKYGFKRPREVEEYNVREDLVAWSMSGAVTS